MRYLGSKAATAETVVQLVQPIISKGSFCDPFGGVGIIGTCFKKEGYKVTAGDILKNAYYFQVARIQRDRQPSFRILRQALGIKSRLDVSCLLNSAIQHSGWFEREYSIRRRFFAPSNARRIAGCRNLIRQWDTAGLLSHSEKAVLLASLTSSMDKVANTAGTYYAFLKSWYRKAKRPFVFDFLSPTRGASGCTANNCRAEDLVASKPFDILYLDPPYNERCYAGYYHLPETIACQTTPKLRGKSGMPLRYFPRSSFNQPSGALDSLTKLVASSSFRLLVFHYADDGLISRRQLLKLFREFGKVEEHIVGVRGYSTSQGYRAIHQRIYVVKHG
jgi:adenine-specific DNA-methyltransferase